MAVELRIVFSGVREGNRFFVLPPLSSNHDTWQSLGFLLNEMFAVPWDASLELEDGRLIALDDEELAEWTLEQIGITTNKNIHIKIQSAQQIERKLAEDIEREPMNAELQRRAEKHIRKKLIAQNRMAAYEYMPEAFAAVNMLYVTMEGMEGVAKGVGTQKIVGRIHSAKVKMGEAYFYCSFTVLQKQEMPMLFGLDQLKRHQCVIDLKSNTLQLYGEHIPFMNEAGIKNADTFLNGGAGSGASSIGLRSAAPAPALAGPMNQSQTSASHAHLSSSGSQISTTMPSSSLFTPSSSSVTTVSSSAAPTRSSPAESTLTTSTGLASVPALTPAQQQAAAAAILALAHQFMGSGAVSGSHSAPSMHHGIAMGQRPFPATSASMLPVNRSAYVPNEQHISQLQELGFAREQCAIVLQQVDGNVDQAAALLLELQAFGSERRT